MFLGCEYENKWLGEVRHIYAIILPTFVQTCRIARKGAELGKSEEVWRGG